MDLSQFAREIPQEPQRKHSLGDYVKQLEATMALIDDANEVTPDLIELFDAAELDVKQKVDNWCGRLDALDAMWTVLERKFNELKKECAKNTALKEKAREYIKFQLETHPDVKLEGTEEKFVLQKNSQKTLELLFDTKPPTGLSNAVDESVFQFLPEVKEHCYETRVFVLDKDRLKKLLEKVEGGKLPFATLKQGSHIRRKMK